MIHAAGAAPCSRATQPYPYPPAVAEPPKCKLRICSWPEGWEEPQAGGWGIGWQACWQPHE